MKTDFQPLTLEEYLNAPSETAKYRHLVAPFLDGLGVDVGSQGQPVCEWAISTDLPEPLFSHYSGGRPPKGPIHLRCFADKLPFDSDSLTFCYSSHFLEDVPYDEWPRFINEWKRVVRPGGHVIIICPERTLWREYLAKGGIPNCSHRHEPLVGEMAAAAERCGLVVVTERKTECYPADYSLLLVARK